MTHNQIDYWKMRNEKLNNEQRNAETKRYNLVQEELKRIDQSLQRDLNAINAKYKAKELEIAAEELEWKKRYQNTQLRLEQSRIDAIRQQNSINAMNVSETKRSNLVQETIARSRLEIDQALAPYTQSKAWSETSVNNARVDLVNRQTKTESTKPGVNLSQMFNNFISPFINIAGSALRAVHQILAYRRYC